MNKDSYILQPTTPVQISGIQELAKNIELEQLNIISNGGFHGKVIDIDEKPIVGATVKAFDITGNPIKHTMTDDKGEFSLINLENKPYIIHAIKDGYALSTAKNYTIGNDIIEIGNITLTQNHILLSGAVYGYLLDSNNKPLSNINVILVNKIADIETIVAETVSAVDGEYVFTGIDAGTYIIKSNEDDYVTRDIVEITIIQGEYYNQKVYLLKQENAKEGTINGIIKDKTTSVPISNANVCLYSVINGNIERLIAITTTNIDGKYFFGKVAEGEYIIKAKSIINI